MGNITTHTESQTQPFSFNLRYRRIFLVSHEFSDSDNLLYIMYSRLSVSLLHCYVFDKNVTLS